MSDQTPVLGLPYILPSQAQKHVTHNQAIDTLDVLVQLRVESRTQSAPASPTTGQAYIVPPASSGDWAGNDNAVAVWRDTYWEFVSALAGWQAFIVDEATPSVFDGMFWGTPVLNLQNVPSIGLNATADAGNRLTSASAGTLLTHDGAGHRVKVNKSSASDTASLLFQDDFSGRAEMGIIGDNDFDIKVSPDGSSFLSALSVNATTALTKVRALCSGTITVGEDAVATIDTPTVSGLVLVFNVANVSDDTDYPKIGHGGIFMFDTGPSLGSAAVFVGNNLQDNDTQDMTGSTSANGVTGFSVRPGQIQIENRQSGNRVFSYTFLGGI